MKKAFLVVGLVLFTSFVVFRVYQETSSRGTAAGAANELRNPGGQRPNAMGAGLLVEAGQPLHHIFETRLEAVGELQPLQKVNVMSRTSGYLQRLTVDRSDAVRRGQLLAEIDDSNLVQQIQRADAAIMVARAGVVREEAALDNLRVQLKRTQDLSAQGLVSRQALEDLESRVRVAEAQVQLSNAQVDQAEASLRELRVQQEQTKVYSPLDGFVAERMVDPGALVTSNTTLVSLVDIRRVKIVVPIPENILPEIREGLPVKVGLDAYPDLAVRGSITRISPVVRSETRSADVEIDIANTEGLLRPGMFARVGIAAGKTRESLSVPRSALITRGQQQGVFVLTGQQTATFRPIEAGRIDGNRVEVLSGLRADETVIVSGGQSLNDGDSVRTDHAPDVRPGARRN